MRSSWKPTYSISPSVTRKKRVYKTTDKALVFLRGHVGQIFSSYNGKQFFKCAVTEGMVGHRLGEFIMTKKTVVRNKRKRKKKQQQSKKKKGKQKQSSKKKGGKKK